MDKVQFILSTIPQMAAYTFRFVTSVIGVTDAESGQHVGSGLRCMLHGRRAVVTAWHVVESAPTYPSGLVISAGYAKHPYLIHGSVHFDRAGDLALYFLPPDFPADSPGVEFWPEARIEQSTDRLATDYLFVHGFPQARSRFVRLLDGVMSKSLPYGAMQRLESLPDNLGADHFAIEFDPSGMRSPEGNPADFIDPHGLSGSAVWRIGVSGRLAAEWRPEDSLVVGFVTQWRPDQRILVASSASRLLSLKPTR